MDGWIKINRAIEGHWIFEDPEKLKAWITILMTVNHEKKKVNIKGVFLDCDRGESLLSLGSWAKKFGQKWNKSKVRRFFLLLEIDTMVVLKSERITTRLTVCNYEFYQGERNANETQMKRKRNADETQMKPTKERKERKEIKESIKESETVRFNSFYDSELEKAKNEKYLKFYLAYIEFLFGKNRISEKVKMLKWKNQISYENYEKLFEMVNFEMKVLYNVAMNMHNYKKNYQSFYLTLRNWVERETVKN